MTNKTIRCKFIGVQHCKNISFPLYNLLEPMGEHPVNSTVSDNTITLHGRKPLVVIDGGEL